ncbi:hypothetical protein [Scytonema sp. PCC 10023]|uniref:hypothetical protein n=1 Tax=Scytonema sp. PCC 10023 TaxID=1680591 RepID=UPI0039C6DEC7
MGISSGNTLTTESSVDQGKQRHQRSRYRAQVQVALCVREASRREEKLISAARLAGGCRGLGFDKRKRRFDERCCVRPSCGNTAEATASETGSLHAHRRERVGTSHSLLTPQTRGESLNHPSGIQSLI